MTAEITEEEKQKRSLFWSEKHPVPILRFDHEYKNGPYNFIVDRHAYDDHDYTVTHVVDTRHPNDHATTAMMRIEDDGVYMYLSKIDSTRVIFDHELFESHASSRNTFSVEENTPEGPYRRITGGEIFSIFVHPLAAKEE